MVVMFSDHNLNIFVDKSKSKIELVETKSDHAWKRYKS